MFCEFPASVASDDKGKDGEGRNMTVSFSGGVAMTYDAFSYSKFRVACDLILLLGLEIEEEELET